MILGAHNQIGEKLVCHSFPFSVSRTEYFQQVIVFNHESALAKLYCFNMVTNKQFVEVEHAASTSLQNLGVAQPFPQYPWQKWHLRNGL